MTCRTGFSEDLQRVVVAVGEVLKLEVGAGVDGEGQVVLVVQRVDHPTHVLVAATE